jgi:hypothetical protein
MGGYGTIEAEGYDENDEEAEVGPDEKEGFRDDEDKDERPSSGMGGE